MRRERASSFQPVGDVHAVGSDAKPSSKEAAGANLDRFRSSQFRILPCRVVSAALWSGPGLDERAKYRGWRARASAHRDPCNSRQNATACAEAPRTCHHRPLRRGVVAAPQWRRTDQAVSMLVMLLLLVVAVYAL